MARLQDVIGYGTHASRPSAGSAGALYFESDTDTLFRDNGATWDALTLDAPSPLTTKGDLFVHGASDARLPVGTDGQVLMADSAQTLGVKWAAGGGGTLTSASNVLSSDVALTTAGTYYDGPSLSLTSGTWVVLATITISNTTGAGTISTLKLWDGTNVFVSSEHYENWSLQRYSYHLSAIVVLSATTTVKVSVAHANNGGAIAANCSSNGSPSKASQMNAIKIA